MAIQNTPTTEDLIRKVLTDIQEKGFSSVSPFDIGEVERRMLLFAEANGVTLASKQIYISAKQLKHCMRTSKVDKGLAVAPEELISFPKDRFSMDLYFDGECFIYANERSKFVIHPNYKMKIKRDQVKLVNFVTATRRTDKKEFNGKRYTKVEADRT